MILRRLFFGLLWSIPAYVIGLVCGMLLVHFGSSNVHDKGLEMLMTGFFATGPLAALVGFVIGALRTPAPGIKRSAQGFQDRH